MRAPLQPRDSSWNNRRDYNSISGTGASHTRPGDSFLRRHGSFAFRKTRQQTQTELQTFSSATTWFLLFFPASIALLFLLIPAAWSQELIIFNPGSAAAATHFPLHPKEFGAPESNFQATAPSYSPGVAVQWSRSANVVSIALLSKSLADCRWLYVYTRLPLPPTNTSARALFETLTLSVRVYVYDMSKSWYIPTKIAFRI